MRRIAGPMPTLTRKLSARRFLFFDTETESQQIDYRTKQLVFRLGHCVYLEYDRAYKVNRMESQDLETPRDFVDVLEKFAPGRGILYCVAHNLSFDLQVLDLPHLLHSAGWQVDLPTLSFSTTLWRVHKEVEKKSGSSKSQVEIGEKSKRKTKISVHFMDSANIFPGKLSNLGKSIDLPKYELNPLDTTEELLWRYCRRDVMILVKLFEKYLKWLRDENLGYFGETLSWQAMNAYRTRFYKGEIVIHEDYVVLGYERLAYSGARTECFFIGEAPRQDYYLLDVNSMYGYVMAENAYPVELLSVEVGVGLEELSRLLDGYYVIAECEVKTDEAVYAYKTSTKLVFPTGKYSTWLHSPSLTWALRCNHISKVRRCLLYRRANIFGEFVGYFNMVRGRAKQTGQTLEENLAKLMLNSLSGKMGQREYKTYILGKANHDGIRHFIAKAAGTDYVFDQWEYFGRVFSSIRAGEKPYSCPSIAGAITAYGRMYLWELMSYAGKENVYYCDTDSLITNSRGLQNLSAYLGETALGKLKIVEQGRSLSIHAPKDFSLDLHARRSGSHADIQELLEPEVVSEEFTRMKTAMKQGVHGSIEVREVLKHRRAQYDKGRVNADGRVTPWVLPDDSEQPVFQAH
jgi:DNA polymerase elongation subunit (family B)